MTAPYQQLATHVRALDDDDPLDDLLAELPPRRLAPLLLAPLDPAGE